VDRSFLNSPFAKTLLVLLFVAAIATWVLWPRRLPAPVESNRVYHPIDGYSIIAPPDWKMSYETAEHDMMNGEQGWMKIEPIQQGHYSPSIEIRVRPPNTDPAELKSKEKFTDGTFQGKPALAKQFRQHRYWAYAIVFKDREKWFDICITTGDYYDFPNSMWWPYIESFKYEPEKAKKPTTATSLPILKLPTTLPEDLIK
jgi:hypothetical protein